MKPWKQNLPLCPCPPLHPAVPITDLGAPHPPGSSEHDSSLPSSGFPPVSIFVVLKPQLHLGSCQEGRISGPTPDLRGQNLPFTQMPRD